MKITASYKKQQIIYYKTRCINDLFISLNSYRFERCDYTYLPVFPSHSLTDLSKEALAMILVSGEKRTSLIRAWCPVILCNGFLSSAGAQRKSVKSSEPDTSLSGACPCVGAKSSANKEIIPTTVQTAQSVAQIVQLQYKNQVYTPELDCIAARLFPLVPPLKSNKKNMLY